VNPETDLFERYPHLLNEQSDPETVALVEQLDTLYRSPELPARLTLAAVLAEREQEDEPRHWFAPSWAFRPIFWLPRRLGTVALALTLAVVLMAASAYAFTSFLRPGLQPPPGDQGISQVFKLHQLVEVHAAPQSINGFTMNVQAAYADANRVIIGYTMTRPSGQSYDDPVLTDALLTTAQGDQLRWEMESPLSGDANTITFTPLTWISSAAQEITFHLSIHRLDVNAGAQHLVLQGSMSFTFSAPFHPARIAAPNQSVTANGKTLTLERVVVSLSTTRLFVQGTNTESTSLYAVLAVGDWQSTQNKSGLLFEIGPVTANEIFISYDDSLFDKQGEWTLTLQVNSFQAPPAPQGTGAPWTFHFVVP